MDQLFAKLAQSAKSNASENNQSPSSAQHNTYREPSVSSPLFSPSPSGPQPHHTSAILSPNTSAMNTPQVEGGAQPPTRATDLLSLLKFRQSGSAATPPAFSEYFSPSDTTSAAQGRPSSSAADLVAGFARRPVPIQSPHALAPAASRPELSRGEASSSSSNPQDYLLRLLNQAPRSNLSEIASPPSQAPQMEILKHERDSSSTSAPSAKTPRTSAETERAPSDGHRETVSEAVSGIGEVVDRQVEKALAQVASKANGESAPKVSEKQKAQKAVQEAAAEIREDLKDEETHKILEAGMPQAMVEAFEETIEAAAESAGADEDWEKAAEKGGRVYTLPMQPFKSIFIGEFEKEPTLIPHNMTMDIAKVKRPFDQIDRNLVAATQNLMIYPLKNGGLRVIRQESGVHKEVFKSFTERIFNVSVSSKKKSSTHPTEVVLATGIDGTVFWAPLSNFATSDDVFGENEEAQGFIFPPVPSSDENTSGGQLKTRVKPSSGHPEYFAYGRGKSIYIIYPNIASSDRYTDSTTRVCKSNVYLKEHMLRICTGKAGKDFIFSSDDTLVISLDKAGRLKFWDIRLLTTPEHEDFNPTRPLEIKVPLMTLATCPATEKSWPTSILLVDKDKPMNRGIALRYVIIGLKQNHTVQLWDLMLGKPVQEINFPHAQESDGICSVVFHAKTGILTVAHPTRNSIYFMHISIPPYTLSPMNQSRFVQMVSAKDASLPAPQSTIIVNGIREYTFSKTSTIRSVDILSEPGAHYGEDAPLFVLYVMHSNGISELKVDRALLGQLESGRIADSTEAAKIPGAIRVENIKPLPAPVVGDSGSVTSESTAIAPSNGIEDARKPGKKAEHTLSRGQKSHISPDNTIAESSTEKPEKKKEKKKKNKEAQTTSAGPSAVTSSAPSPFAPPIEFLKPVPDADLTKARVVVRKPGSDGKTVSSEAVETTYTEATGPESSRDLSTTGTAGSVDLSNIEAILKTEFETLHHNISQDRLKQDASANMRQEAVLKAVSRTLTENVEDSLTRVVTEGLTKVTISPLKEVVASNIDRTLSGAFQQAMKIGVPAELQKALPVAFEQTLKDKDILKGLSDKISQDVSQKFDAQFAAAMKNTLTPAISKLVTTATKSIASDIEHRFNDHLRVLEAQKQKDNNTIAGLTQSLDSMKQVVVNLMQSQQQFQQETMSMLNQIQEASIQAATAQQPSARAIAAPPTEAKPLTEADLERAEIQDDFAHNEVESATLKWMHSKRKIELFDEVFLYVDPRFLHGLGPLLVLSVAATVSESFETNIRERLGWLELCLGVIDPKGRPHTQEFEEVLPSVLDVILQRVQTAYMDTSAQDHQAPILKHMHLVARKLQDLKSKAS